MTDYVYALTTAAAVLLVLAAKIMAGKLLSSDDPRVKFGLGLGLFAIYNCIMLMGVVWLCTFDGGAIPDELASRALTGWLVVNLAAVFGACLFYFTREKRKLSQTDKMKLKDL